MSEFITYMIKVAVLSAAFIGLYHLLLRRETFHKTNRIILVASLVLSYILPLCVITVHKEGAPVSIQKETPKAESPMPTVEAGSVYTETDTPAATHNLTQVIEVPREEVPKYTPAIKERKQIDWWKIVGVVYIIGLIGILAFRILSTSKVIGIIKKGHVIDKSDACTVVQSEQPVHPFSWMKFIVLPEKGKAAGQSEILDHEKAHLAHHHSLELLLTDLLSALQWFNPALILFRHDLCSIHEFQADADVLETGCDRRQYQYLLLDCATEKTEFRAANTFRKSTLEGRIDMINRKKSSKSSTLKLAYLPVLLLVSLSAFAEKVYDKTPSVNLDEVVEVGNYVRIDGLWYKFKGKEARVVSRKTEHAYPAEIVIPDAVIYKNVRYSVTSVSQPAFKNAQEIKSVTLPSTIREIEEETFYGCTNLKSVTLPPSVRQIGRRAFANCTNLSSITIPAGVKLLEEQVFIGDNLEYIAVDPENQFYDSRDNCNAIIQKSSDFLVAGSANTVVPQSVTVIGDHAFEGNGKLESFAIPSQITKIGEYAFRNCTSLKEIDIPETVNDLGYDCFGGSGIRRAKVNGNIEGGISYAFNNCKEMEVFEIGPEVTELDIPGSPNLKSLNIPATVLEIHANYSFGKLTKLESVTVDPANPVYDSRDNCNAIIETATDRLVFGCAGTVIPNTVRSINEYAFSGSSIKKLYIPASVTDIVIYPDFGNYAAKNCFANPCYELESITVDPANPVYDSRDNCNAIIRTATNTLLYACAKTVIPKTVTAIGPYAFADIEKLNEIAIPDNVTNIREFAFGECRNLKKVSFGSGVSEISRNQFSGCEEISDIRISPENTKYKTGNEGKALFDAESDELVLGRDAEPEWEKEIYVEGETYDLVLKGDEATVYRLRTMTAHVKIPETYKYEGKEYTVTEIAGGLFSEDNVIVSISLPKTIRRIGDRAFSGCTSLKEVSLKDGLESIGDDAFSGCSRLEKLKLPSTLQSIGRTAFTRSGLKSLEIPASVTDLGLYITLDCKNLASLSVNPKNTVFDSRKHCNAIIKTESDVLLAGCRNTRIPQGVVAIGPYAFAGLTGIKSMDIPSSVQFILDQAFAFSSIENIDIPASVSLITDPFYGCANIKSIKVQNGNPTYSSPTGSNAVITNGNDCRVINSEKVVQLLDGFGLGHYLERESGTLILGCVNTVIPQSAKIIGTDAFSYREGLEKTDIPETVTRVEYDAFSHCPDLKEIHIPASVTEFGRMEFYSNLEKITVEEGNPVYDSRNGCNALIHTEDGELMMGCRNTVIPNGVRGISGHSFEHVRGLKSIDIPEGVICIGRDAFFDCEDLESVTIPKSMIGLDHELWEEPDFEYDPRIISRINPFSYCPNLKRITVNPENPVYDSRENCNAVILKSLGLMLVGCAETIEPESVVKVHSAAYFTLESGFKGADYLGTEWIFNRNLLIDTVWAPDYDD